MLGESGSSPEHPEDPSWEVQVLDSLVVFDSLSPINWTNLLIQYVQVVG